jgi:GT2 family glycosyltransferase
VVIACFNGVRTIERQLDALAAQAASFPWEIVVADNGSTDGSRDVVRAYAERLPNLKLIDASRRRGLAHARNAGAAAADGSALAFCDQDDQVAQGWLNAMAAALDRHEFVAGRLEHDRLNDRLAIAVRGRPQTDGLMTYEEGEYFPYAFGCTLGIERPLHEAIGGFDEIFAKGCEDADYCWRLQQSGGRLEFVPDAVTHYQLRHELGAIYRQARDYGASEALLYAKHRPRGLPAVRRPGRKTARVWGAAAKRLLLARDRAGLAVALWRLGQRIGRLQGSVRHKVLFP